MGEEFKGGYNPEDGMYYAKGSFDNENEYNNEVICLVNHTEANFQTIGAALEEKRYVDVDQVLTDFVLQNTNNIEALDKLGSYKSDSKLLDTAKEYLHEITDMVQTVYAKTIQLVKTGEGTPQELSAGQENFTKRYHDATTKLSTAFQEFMQTYSELDEFDPKVGGYNPGDGQYYPKGSYDNEAEYYNEVIHLVNFKDDYINNISEAFNNEQFKTVEDLFSKFIEHSNTSKEKLEKLGAYDGDLDLLNSSTQYLDSLNSLVKKEYQELLNVLRAEDRPLQEFQEKQQVFFEKIESVDNQLGEALEKFMEKYDTDNLSESVYHDENMHQGMERKEHDSDNPYLQPIHGISLQDYAAASSKMANGLTEDQVAKALGVERPQWDEANQLWQTRMQQDTEMTVIGLFGEYFGTADQNPKFQNLSDDSSAETNQENLARIKEDPEFYFELTAAMQAAYSYGMDGAQWLRDNYGLSIGEFQGVAMQWAYSPVYIAMIPTMEEKVKQYAEKFASEMGGNVADDVEF